MNSRHDPENSDEEEEEEDARELKLPKAFQTAEALTNSEVNTLLTHYIEIKRKADPNYQVHPMTKLAQAYAERFSNTKNRDTIVQMRELMASHNLNPFELGAVANLCPENAEEARTLVPSLFQDGSSLSDEDVDQLLADLATMRQNQ